MKRIRVVNALVVLGLMFAAPGCATVTSGGGGDQKVTIVADPPGATVIVDGQPSGATPAVLSLARKSEHNVEIAAPGYETAHVTIRRQINPWVLGNLLVGGPIGLIVDMVTDATHTLSPDELKVKLRPLATPGVVPTSGVAYPIAPPSSPTPPRLPGM